MPPTTQRPPRDVLRAECDSTKPCSWNRLRKMLVEAGFTRAFYWPSEARHTVDPKELPLEECLWEHDVEWVEFVDGAGVLTRVVVRLHGFDEEIVVTDG